MRYFLVLLALLPIPMGINAQVSEDFKIFIQIESSPLKDQQSSGTCWSFATCSFLETEAIRLGHKSISISPIFYVSPTYIEKAEKYIESKGKTWFSPGDLTFSVLKGYKEFGAVPEEAYNGIIEDDKRHDHLEMDNLLYEMVKSIGTSGYGRIKPNSWKQSIIAVLHAYLGEAPTTFIFEGKEYTPKTFADNFIGIDPDDYIEITSYSHFNYFEKCVLNIPANWNEGKYLNLPILEFEKTINHALKNGYSLAWDGDASEPGFNFEKGIMELPIEQENSTITQSMRQSTFEDQTTTDDHNMHIIGMALDKNGKNFYLLKNSEGDNEQGGYIYMSKNALLLKTISVLVHKEAIPTEIKIKH